MQTSSLLWWLLPATMLASWIFTGLIRRYALAHNVLDVPNERSSHTHPTPRGGGIAIALGFLMALPLLSITGLNSWQSTSAVFWPAALVSIIGFLDDHRHVPARWRLAGHFTAAIWALVALGGFPPALVFGEHIYLGWLGHIFAAVYLVWTLNLYNFMDGIDGIAGVQALCVLLGGAALFVLVSEPTLAAAPVLLSSAVVGFLCWNLPPARIFMGDSGSGFLGIAVGIISIQAAWSAPELFWSWLILLGVFIVDATCTLLRRLFSGERVYEAHRSHAYQHAAKRYGSHRVVTVAVLAINVLWLYPIAWFAGVGTIDGSIALILAYAPLVLIALKYRAGISESPSRTA